MLISECCHLNQGKAAAIKLSSLHEMLQNFYFKPATGEGI